MTVKELLKAWGYAVFEISAIQRQITKITLNPGGGCKGIILTDMPRGTNDPMSAAVQALDHYDAMLEEVKQEKAALLEETERMLKTVDDSLARIILRHYYGEGLKDSQIADVLHKARETITRRRTMAENYLQKTFTVSQNITDNHN
jgi:DNA-directed RNA polymerase specialized sigma24 family protein